VQALGAYDADAEVSRSFLFVPADSERKLEKAGTSRADALILDLEDSVAASARPKARQLAAQFLQKKCDADVLPKPRGAGDANQLAKLLDVLEQESDLDPGQTGILPVATERPAALFSMDEYAESTARLAGLTWGAEDLSTAVGASSNRDESGNWLPPYQLARSLCLFAAAAAGVPAIDTVYTDFKDTDGLAEFAAAARRDGFEGMLAIHPDQVPVPKPNARNA
jgi:citrate lyase subunit beta/citryl-CoA lyase